MGDLKKKIIQNRNYSSLNLKYSTNKIEHTKMCACWNISLEKVGDILQFHIMYSDVIMDAMTSEITGVSVVYSTVVQAQIKESSKAPRHWPLWGESLGDR